MKTVTRIMGDKSHSVIEKKNKNTIEETEEYFQNFDHDKIDEFNKQWHGQYHHQYQKPALKHEVTREIAKQDDSKNSFFSKIFSWLR